MSYYSSSIPQLSAHSSSDKINRELFVGNTPPGTSELLILHFLSAAMRRVGLCEPAATPIVDSRVNNKFAFIELATNELADKALSLNGIPFLGVFLKVSRPSKYHGHLMQAPTWQELTGQRLPTGAAIDGEQDKLSRELFIGNTTPEMTEGMIKEFLGNAMLQVGLAKHSNPITACRVSGKFAFVELRSAEEATAALNLNNIPYLGSALRVGRPSKWQGPPDHAGNWEDVLAKYMAEQVAVPEPAPTRIVELLNMVTEDDLRDDGEYADIVEDTREECSQFGQLQSVVVPRPGQVGVGKVFLAYVTPSDAAAAIDALQGRTFDGRQVQARYFDETAFAQGHYNAA